MAQEPGLSTRETGREQSPEEIRANIRDTRADMDVTLNQIEDRVSPTRIRDRQVNRARSRWERTRSSVMGSPDWSSGGGSGARDRAHDAADSVREAPDRTKDMTRGNPLAAGLIAFGVGALAGSLIPASRQEQQAAHELRDRFEEPVKQEAQRMGQEAKESLQPAAQRRVDETKQSAQEGAQHVKDDAQGSAESVRDEAQRAKDRTQQA